MSIEYTNTPSDSCSILVVDDDDLFLQYCQRVLDDSAAQVDIAVNGFEGLEKSQTNNYDVILLDIAMPHMNGLECLDELQKTGCRAIVIMVTGGGDVATAVEAMKRGAADYIQKPFGPDNLRTRINEALNKKEQRQEKSEQFSRDPVIAYIQKNAAQVNSRQDVDPALGLSLDQVSARIQAATGQSFRQLLHTCRLKRAMRLL
ncbi:MAG: response regulator [Candidatus Latescibacterota bacterium]|jgi:two-component system chemotaxis response regulator CheY